MHHQNNWVYVGGWRAVCILCSVRVVPIFKIRWEGMQWFCAPPLWIRFIKSCLFILCIAKGLHYSYLLMRWEGMLGWAMILCTSKMNWLSMRVEKQFVKLYHLNSFANELCSVHVPTYIHVLSPPSRTRWVSCSKNKGKTPRAEWSVCSLSLYFKIRNMFFQIVINESLLTYI